MRILISLSLIAGCCAACSASEYTVARSATIESQRPIWLLILETGLGVLDEGNRRGASLDQLASEGRTGRISTSLRIDGRQMLDSQLPVAQATLGIEVSLASDSVWAKPETGPRSRIGTAESVGRVAGEITAFAVKAGMGVLSGSNKDGRLEILDGARLLQTTLWVDGRQQEYRTSAFAVWRLAGFILWDAEGSVERVTVGQYRGRSVRIVDGASNGRVWVRVTVGPPLGGRRVKQARLTLEASEYELSQLRGSDANRLLGTTVRLSCAIDIDAPGCRLARRICERKAGPELSSRVETLAAKGRGLALAGRRDADAFTIAGRERLIETFLKDTCR